MKKALIYSFIFHILLFIFILLLQDYFKSQQPSEPVSVIIVPLSPQVPKIPPSAKATPPKTLEKLPPIRESKQPKYLSAIPKGNQGQKEEKQKETASTGNLKTEKHFTELTPKQSPNIFDKDVIARLSRKSKEKQELETSRGLSFSAKEFNDWGYLERLKEKIERVWQYPPQAAQRGIYGDLYLRFTIDKKGKLVSVELLRTSGYRMLDDAAIKALKDAEPFWPLPDDWQKNTLTITGHFIYTLHGFYLR
ncbi:energy transducer TonB [Thermodesulfovibrio sp. Kuro-1]|uniref:energy transducer TonB n=1 Tax=Thermodesulfovibrio sp. Kuro-1 TaxID=2580394 RepID=UPI0011411A4B|nr:energy transducer TonB [Thermodesulfovibrio sp. Kuro-1]